MSSPRENTEPQTGVLERVAEKTTGSNGYLGNSLGSRLTNAEYDPNLFTSPMRGEEPITRSLMSRGPDYMDTSGGVKRTSKDTLTQSRLKKKKASQSAHAETRSSALLQSIAPKLGPTLRIKPRDTEQLKKSIEEIKSRRNQSLALGLNFLLGWSSTDKGDIISEEIQDVMSVLLDFVLEVIDREPTSAEELFEDCQSSSMVSESIQQCMAAGLILKNIAVSPSKPTSLGCVSKKIVHLVICLLSKRVPQTSAESGRQKAFYYADDIPYSLTRDVLYLVKLVSSLDGMGTELLAALMKTLFNRSCPLRLRTTVLDVLSDFLYQTNIKDSLIASLESGHVEMKMHLKLMMMLPLENAMKEAEFEFEGGLDYEGIAILSDNTQNSWKEDLKLSAWRLQAEALFSSTTFLIALASSDSLELIACDDCILQVLVDLTTGKKLVDMFQGDKSFLDSKHELMLLMRRLIRSSEMQAYRMILDTLQQEMSLVKDKLRMFEDQFVVSAFDNTWEAKQCAMVLSMMKGSEVQTD